MTKNQQKPFNNKKLGYIITLPVCTLALIVAFQNCEKGGGKGQLPQTDVTPTLVPGNTSTTTSTTLLSLTIVAKEDPSVNPTATSRDHFPVNTKVQLELSPSTHPLVQGTTAFSWLINTTNFWSSIVSCQQTDDCGPNYPEDGICRSSSSSCTYELPEVNAPFDTEDLKLSYTFSEVGVYDIKGGKQIAEENPIETFTSLVIGKCDSDFAIVEQHSIDATTTTSTTSTIATRESASGDEQPADYSTTFILNLGGELLNIADLELANADDTSPTPRVKWRVLFEVVVNNAYSIWESRLFRELEYEDSNTWAIHWNDLVDSNANSPSPPASSSTSTTLRDNANVPLLSVKLSGKVIIEAFAEDLNEGCIHADKTTLTLPQAVIDHLTSQLNTPPEEPEPLPVSTPGPTPEVPTSPVPVSSPTTSPAPVTSPSPVASVSPSTISTTTTTTGSTLACTCGTARENTCSGRGCRVSGDSDTSSGTQYVNMNPSGNPSNRFAKQVTTTYTWSCTDGRSTPASCTFYKTECTGGYKGTSPDTGFDGCTRSNNSHLARHGKSCTAKGATICSSAASCQTANNSTCDFVAYCDTASTSNSCTNDSCIVKTCSGGGFIF